MPQDYQTPAGEYKVKKRFRNEETIRHQKDLPWRKSVLDLDRNAVCGRTACQWCKILLFYLLLYFAIFMICLVLILIFYWAIIDDKIPCVKKDQPGVSIVPRMGSIALYPNIPTENYGIAEILDEFVDKLEGGEKFKTACNKDTLWGYVEKKPCVLVKLNKVIGFVADTYDKADELPDSAADHLSQVLVDYPGAGKIWLTCNTKESRTIIFNFIPGPYFDTTTNMKGANRVVAVQFLNLPENEAVAVKCKVWAKNIEIDEEYTGRGHAKFKIHMHVRGEKAVDL